MKKILLVSGLCMIINPVFAKDLPHNQPVIKISATINGKLCIPANEMLLQVTDANNLLSHKSYPLTQKSASEYVVSDIAVANNAILSIVDNNFTNVNNSAKPRIDVNPSNIRLKPTDKNKTFKFNVTNCNTSA